MNNKKEPAKGPDIKKPGKSGFNLIFTLIFVVFMAMFMLNMFGGDSDRNSIEIQQNTFKRLLTTCRIVHLDVGYEKTEGWFIKDQRESADVFSYITGNESDFIDDPELSRRVQSFVINMGQRDILELMPSYSHFVGREYRSNQYSELESLLKTDRIFVKSYYTVTINPTMFRTSTEDEQNHAKILADEPGTYLFVDFFEGGKIARFNRYAFTGASTGPLNSILSSINEKFPNTEFGFYDFQNEESLRYNKPNTFWTTILAPLIPWILIIGLLWFFIIRQMRVHGGGGNVLSFGRSRATLVNKDKEKITFNDVAGIEEAKEEVQEIVEFLKDPSKFSRLGGRIPSGVLLVGAPGTGKTLLAKAIAGEADVPFYSICGSDFVEMFVGVGASRVRDLFRQARENSPCLIFLDEIDAVGRKRGAGLGGGHDEREQTLNAILVEMDGFEKDEGIILVAATNRPDVLDAALLRPGRFDREIVIDLPDLRGREAILKVHCTKIKMSDVVDLSIIARGTPGFSGAEIAALVNEAALLATMKERSAVEMQDMEEARDKVRWGRQKKSRVMDDEDRLVTAYHESGHALVANLDPEAENIHKVTIIPRGAALGATMILPEKDKYHFRRKELLANIKVLYAGRISEEIFCGDISGGAKNDIERATEIARSMVCQLGMSDKLGPISYGEHNDHVFLGEELSRSRVFSDDMARQIDQEVKRILDECYLAAEKVLKANEDSVKTITKALMEFETITGAEVKAILSGTPYDKIDFEYAPKPEELEKKEDVSLDSTADDKIVEENEDLDPGDLPTAGEPAY